MLQANGCVYHLFSMLEYHAQWHMDMGLRATIQDPTLAAEWGSSSTMVYTLKGGLKLYVLLTMPVPRSDAYL